MKKLIVLFIFVSVFLSGLNLAAREPGVNTGRIGGAHLEYDWLIILPANFWFNIYHDIEVKVVKDLKRPRYELHRREKKDLLIIYVGTDDLKDKWLDLIEKQRMYGEDHHNYSEVIPRVIRR